ncbi:MAG: DUF4956 domain-containing protein [Christensenellales bacterium]|nr:DUF4956 domain-containing protein [Clostridiales bacterium]MBS6942031.1 DUF4956 domain-containing protein [Clostridiales bacterium]
MGDFFSNLVAGLQNAFSFGDLSVVRILLTLGLAFLIGMYIFAIYRKTFSGVMYSKNFGVSLVMLAMITSFIILPITSNLTLSLGMVGALSIVRFRTAVKDPIDTVYMFWSIAVGIALGAKFFLPAILASAVIGVLMLLLSGMRFRSTMPYLLVLRFNENATNNVYGLLKRLPESQLKSKTVGSAGVEMTLEIRLRESDLQVVERFLEIPGVYDASIISYGGDIVA